MQRPAGKRQLVEATDLLTVWFLHFPFCSSHQHREGTERYDPRFIKRKLRPKQGNIFHNVKRNLLEDGALESGASFSIPSSW